MPLGDPMGYGYMPFGNTGMGMNLMSPFAPNNGLGQQFGPQPFGQYGPQMMYGQQPTSGQGTLIPTGGNTLPTSNPKTVKPYPSGTILGPNRSPVTMLPEPSARPSNVGRDKNVKAPSRSPRVALLEALLGAVAPQPSFSPDMQVLRQSLAGNPIYGYPNA